MKKSSLLYTFLFTFFISAAIAQPGNIVVFSEDGYPFKLMINGEFQNEVPKANVKLTNLEPNPYKVKLFFTDTALGTITDQLYLNAGMEQKYVVKKKIVGDGEKTAKKLGEDFKGTWGMKTREEANAKKAEIDTKNERFVLKKQAETRLAPVATTQASSNANPGAKSSNSQATVNASSGTTSTTSSTTVSSSAPANAKGSNVNMNVNINAGSSTTHTTTTTSTTTSAPDHFIMNGYNGPIGCPWPMNDADFQGVKQSISSKSFDDSKLTMAKQVLNSNCLFSSQVKEIMLLFSFEDTRLQLAKDGYGHTYDIGNYYKVIDAFTFESSIDELNAYINARK